MSCAYYVRNWTYYARDELTNEHISATGLYFPLYNGIFNYVADAADNLTTIRNQPTNGINADNQSADVSLNYDGNGNPTDFLQYDLNDQLVNVALGGKNVLSTYRSDGLRASKQILVSPMCL